MRRVTTTNESGTEPVRLKPANPFADSRFAGAGIFE